MKYEHSRKQQTISDAAFDFAYNMALRDATLRAASPGVSLNELRSVPEARDVVKRHIEWILREVRADYDTNTKYGFYETAKSLEQAFRNKFPSSSFTFGNAQKVINMTAKYLYIGAQYNPDMRARFSVCHCPMDSTMIDFITAFVNSGAISNLEASEQDALLNFEQKCMRKIKQGTNEGKFVWNGPAWSSMTDREIEKYEPFQKVVEIAGKHSIPSLSRLEVDLVNWRSPE